MKKIKIGRVIWIVTTLLAGPSLAATETGSFAVRGLGSESCSEVTEVAASDPSTTAALSHWISGYLSRANRVSPSTFEVMPIADSTVVAQVTLVLCASSPDAMVESVVDVLIENLVGGVQTSETPLLEVNYDGRVTTIRSEALRLLQARLVALGHLPEGAADGAFGPQSRSAFSAYQQAVGLDQTGLPDVPTIVSLLSQTQ